MIEQVQWNIGAHISHLSNKRREWRCSGTNESMKRNKYRQTLASKTVVAKRQVRTMAYAKDYQTKEPGIDSRQWGKKRNFIPI